MIFQFSDGHRIFRPSNITEDVERKQTQKSATVKTYIKEHIWGFQADFVLTYWVFYANSA